MVGLMFVLKIVSVPIYILLPGQSTSDAILEGGAGLVLVSFLFLPIETLFGQAAPIAVLRFLGVRSWLPLTATSAAFFGLLHLGAGAQGFVIGFTTGVPLALCYLAWRDRSVTYAIVATTLVHCGHNAIALPIAWITCSHEHRHLSMQEQLALGLPELVSAIVASLSSKVQNVLATTLNGLSEALNFLGTDVGSKLQSVGQMAADDLKVMGNTAGGVGNGFLGILEGGAGGVVGAAGALGNLLGTPGAAEAAGAGQNLATAAQQNFNAASQNFTAAGGNLQSAWGNLGGAAVTPAELALVGQIADAFNKDTYIKYVIAQVRNAISSITAADVKVGVTGKASFELADEI
jgi:hypothetical protein